MLEPRGIPMLNGDEITIPIYIFEIVKDEVRSLIASGEGSISKTSDRYFASFEFEAPNLSQVTLKNQIDLPLYLVHDSRGDRTSIGEIRFIRQLKEFRGHFEFDEDPNLDILMRTARSLVNAPPLW